MKAWTYFAKGAVVGPVDADQLLFAAERGEIDLDTLVYTDEFGPDTPENWKQLGFTELADKMSKVMDISDTLARDVADVASTTLSHNTADVASSTLSRDVLDIAWEPQQDKDNHEALIEPPPIPQRDNDNEERSNWHFVETPNPLMREIQTKRWLRGIGIGIILFFIVIGITNQRGVSQQTQRQIASSPLEQQIASINAGHIVSEDDITVARFRYLLKDPHEASSGVKNIDGRVTPYAGDDPEQIAHLLVYYQKTYRGKKESTYRSLNLLNYSTKIVVCYLMAAPTPSWQRCSS